MPHKHKRSSRDAPSHDLPPTSVANPLPVGKEARKGTKEEPASKKRKRKTPRHADDDTPAEFKRLMAFKVTGRRPSGYDDGTRSAGNKKRKLNVSTDPIEEPAPEQVKRLPHERFSDFASRVDQALPISGLSNKGKKSKELKERPTRLQKKITRKQDAWRVEEARRKERREAALDEAELEEAIRGVENPALDAFNKGIKKRKRGNAQHDEDEDPFAKLNELRGQRPALTDVAKAPPKFTRIPKTTFKVHNNARVDVGDVPAASGSLRRREELSSARKGVIEKYRRMMQGRRDT